MWNVSPVWCELLRSLLITPRPPTIFLSYLKELQNWSRWKVWSLALFSILNTMLKSRLHLRLTTIQQKCHFCRGLTTEVRCNFVDPPMEKKELLFTCPVSRPLHRRGMLLYYHFITTQYLVVFYWSIRYLQNNI